MTHIVACSSDSITAIDSAEETISVDVVCSDFVRLVDGAERSCT